MDTNNLKKAREAAHYTQTQAAVALGVSDGTYKNYEQGKREPNNALLSKIADLYHVSTDYLLGREKPTPNPISLLNLPDDTEAVVDAISKMPAATQKIMVDLLLQLADAVNVRRDSDADNVREIVKTILKTVYYDAASAGTGEQLSDEPPAQIEIIATPEAEAADCVIRVHGDSMEPTFSNGDLALVVQQSELMEGEIGIFLHNSTGYIKEYSKDGLISHNANYKMIPKSQLEGCMIFGKVIGKAEQAK